MIDQLSIIEPYGLFLSEFVKAGKKFKRNKRKFEMSLSHFGENEGIISKKIFERA